MSEKTEMLMSDDAVLRHLGIDDFRHMTQKNTIEFIGSIHRIDPQVASKIIEQFPQVVQMGKDLADQQTAQLKAALDSNNKSVEAQYEATKAIASILGDLVQKDELTTEERLACIETLGKIPAENREIDRDNKNFFLKIGAMGLAGIGMIALSCLAVLGLNTKEGSPDDSTEAFDN